MDDCRSVRVAFVAPKTKELLQWRSWSLVVNGYRDHGDMRCTLYGYCLLTVPSSANVVRYWSLYIKHQLRLYTFARLTIKSRLPAILPGTASLFFLLQVKSFVPEGKMYIWAENVRMCVQFHSISQNLCPVLYMLGRRKTTFFTTSGLILLYVVDRICQI